MASLLFWRSPQKYKWSVEALIFLTLVSCSKDTIDEGKYLTVDLEQRQYAGGGTTVFLTSSNSFGTPAPNLRASELETHFAGDVEFEKVFVSAPAEVNPGVGPIFNNTSCIACHPKDGRSPFPNDINALSGFFLRVSVPGIGENGGANPVPGYGLQVQNQALFGHEPEAKFNVHYSIVEEKLADGTVVQLKKPQYGLTNLYTPLPTGVLMSPRLAPPVFGLGLLEAIPESSILANEDPADRDGDGISGRANYVWDIVANERKLGRFGWKANAPTVMQQCAEAYLNDIGVTSTLLPYETGEGQTNGSDGLGDDPEITMEALERVAFYCSTLAVPAPRNIDKEEVINGAAIFEELKCVACHIPKMETGIADIEALSNQVIYPYTDMLLHDMGDGLADGRSDFMADGNEWKTRPLWGIGLTEVVNGYTHFLHDGRAKNLTEAILWHGGEANASKEAFKSLGTQEREDLLAFLKSL